MCDREGVSAPREGEGVSRGMLVMYLDPRRLCVLWVLVRRVFLHSGMLCVECACRQGWRMMVRRCICPQGWV